MTAPGKSDRDGISLIKLFRTFPDDDTAKIWIEKQVWPDGAHCPHCGSMNVQAGIKHKTMTHRCRDCADRPIFSLRTGTAMEGSKLGYQTWVIAIYLVTTGLKGVSSMKLHRDLEITQKSAWHLAHRLRKAFEAVNPVFDGPVEVDETYIGGKERNKHSRDKLRAGRGAVGKVAVIGAKDRATNKITANAIADTTAITLKGFVNDKAAPSATIFTDEHRGYAGLQNHATVRHSVGQYVDGQAHTNGIESFLSMLKRGYHGTCHKMSAKHLDRHVTEFAGRHNIRNLNTIDQMTRVILGLDRKRLRYKDLASWASVNRVFILR